jgi:transposase-like protein
MTIEQFAVCCLISVTVSYRKSSTLNQNRIFLFECARWSIKRYNEEHGTTIIIPLVKHLNNIIEQDHRAVKRVTPPMLGFKSFEAAQSTLAGVELMHMLKKRQLMVDAGDEGLTVAEQFYALAA